MKAGCVTPDSSTVGSSSVHSRRISGFRPYHAPARGRSPHSNFASFHQKRRVETRQALSDPTHICYYPSNMRTFVCDNPWACQACRFSEFSGLATFRASYLTTRFPARPTLRPVPLWVAHHMCDVRERVQSVHRLRSNASSTASPAGSQVLQMYHASSCISWYRSPSHAAWYHSPQELQHTQSCG
jgi:hypothetical protein